MSRIYVQTWQDTYLSVLPYGYLFEMSVPQHEQAFFDELNSKQIISFVAEEAGRIVGFITGGYESNGDDVYSGEIYTLYVLKNFQRQGVGAKLESQIAQKAEIKAKKLAAPKVEPPKHKRSDSDPEKKRAKKEKKLAAATAETEE